MSPAARDAYRDLLVKLMADDDRLYCLDSDTGLFTKADFGRAAERYVNLGIAEHNLMGVAAGLAASGKVPFVNTMATFATTRALEALKVDIAYNALPVRIVATHGGLSAGHLGPTHHALEDLAILRTLPGFTVVIPADATAAEEAVSQSLDLPGPVYIRVGPQGHSPDRRRADRDRQGAAAARRARHRDLRVRARTRCWQSLEAARLLAELGVEASVLNVHTLKPLDVEAIVAAAERGTGGDHRRGALALRRARRRDRRDAVRARSDACGPYRHARHVRPGRRRPGTPA